MAPFRNAGQAPYLRVYYRSRAPFKRTRKERLRAFVTSLEGGF